VHAVGLTLTVRADYDCARLATNIILFIVRMDEVTDMSTD